MGDALPTRNGRAGAGILVAGNEQIVNLFQPRRGQVFEQWRSRIEQREIRVLGPSREEARRILREELSQPREETVERIIDGCTVNDPLSRKRYVNVRRMFNTIKDVQGERAKKRVQ